MFIRQKVNVTAQKFTVRQDDTLVTIILRNNTELNRALQ